MEALVKTKHLQFQQSYIAGRKTPIYYISSNTDSDAEMSLGTITWYSQWRRYVFTPTPKSIVCFDHTCLLDIANFIDTLMQERKAHEPINQ